ncbi:hypothetical protein [Aliikangiella sp. IMCC44632]
MGFNINYGNENYRCAVDFDREGEIKQGQTLECEFFLTHEPHVGKLAKGMEFKLFTGNVVFSHGEIQLLSE